MIEPSTRVHVETVGADGKPRRSRVNLYDDAGRNQVGLSSIPAFASGRGPASTATAHDIGPVPSGAYRLEAISESGQVETRELELGATPELELRVAFED